MKELIILSALDFPGEYIAKSDHDDL